MSGSRAQRWTLPASLARIKDSRRVWMVALVKDSTACVIGRGSDVESITIPHKTHSTRAQQHKHKLCSTVSCKLDGILQPKKKKKSAYTDIFAKFQKCSCNTIYCSFHIEWTVKKKKLFTKVFREADKILTKN